MSDNTGHEPAFPLAHTEAAMYASCMEDLANPALHDRAEISHLEAKAEALCGLTQRQFAAIKLKVPDSGTDWLDEMIKKSLRNDFAAKAMQSDFAAVQLNGKCELYADIAERSYIVADTMQKASDA